MSNRDANTGFRPVRYLNGQAYNGAFVKSFSDNDNLFMGDLVELDTTATAHQDGVYNAVGRYDQGDKVYGVVVGWEPNPSSLENLYHTASTVYPVYIAECRDLVMEVQSDDATMVQSDVGLNVDVTVAAGATATGLSFMEINGDTAAATTTLDMHIVGMVDRADNDVSDSVANQRFLVVPNLSFWVNNKTGV